MDRCHYYHILPSHTKPRFSLLDDRHAVKLVEIWMILESIESRCREAHATRYCCHHCTHGPASVSILWTVMIWIRRPPAWTVNNTLLIWEWTIYRSLSDSQKKLPSLLSSICNIIDLLICLARKWTICMHIFIEFNLIWKPFLFVYTHAQPISDGDACVFENINMFFPCKY